MPVVYTSSNVTDPWILEREDPWNTWVDTTTTAASSTQIIWTNWNTANTTITYQPVGSVDDYRRRVINAIDEQDRSAKERADRWKEAEKRAEELLQELLDDQQWATWLKSHDFKVTGSEGGKYLIKKGYAGNVYQLNDQGRAVAKLCIHPEMRTAQGNLPETDAVIAQLLTLRTDEAEFRRIANITPYALAA